MTQWNAPQGDPRGPGYGQPHGAPYAPPVNTDSFGIVGTVLALLGGVILIVSFTALDWFSGSIPGGGNASLSFSDISDRSASLTGFASAYFGWLAWLFLIVVVIAGVLASVPSPALRAFRIVGAVVGFAAAGLTFLAIKLGDGLSYTEILKNASIGFYFAVVGFVVAGIGAAIGPRRV